MANSTDCLRHALSVGQNDPAQAARLLAKGLADAEATSDTDGVALLARHLAVFRFTLGDYPGAVDSYRAVLGVVPTDYEVYLALGNALARMSNWVDARDSLARCLELARDAGDNEVVEAALRAMRLLSDDHGRGP